MVRAVLIGALLAAGAGCDKSAKPPAAQVEAAAGRVAEVTGKATATRAGTSRELAAGADVFRDDTIDTGADGAVVIELFHNNARWSIEGRKARVDESVAWKLAKQAPSGKPVEHATSSAGRDAERQGAGTRVTADRKPAAAVERNQSRGGKDEEKSTTARGGGDTAPSMPEPVMSPGPKGETARGPRLADPMAQVKSSVEAHREELRACLGASTAVLSINIVLVEGVASVKVSGIADAKARGCVEAIVKKLPLPVADLDTTVIIK